MNIQNDKSIILFNLSFFGGQIDELLSLMTEQLGGGEPNGAKPLMVVTPNPEQVILTRKQPDFLHALQNVDFRIPDGIGLIYASKILGRRYGLPSLTNRVTGKSLVQQLLSWAAQRPIKVLVIGGRELGLTSNSAKSSMPSQGLHHLKSLADMSGNSIESNNWFWLEGYRQVSVPTAEEEMAVQKTLQQLKPDLVFVAFGAPDQELWLESHRELLQHSGVKVAMVVGGAFDVLTGSLQPPPAWMEQSGLEWAFRLWQQPSRWRRQLSLVSFAGLVLQACFDRTRAGITQSQR
jgi:N-acetylglucosaminyldiphosphoundecaprenol N-acetyl-beta-D-mannosaminyltransferase